MSKNVNYEIACQDVEKFFLGKPHESFKLGRDTARISADMAEVFALLKERWNFEPNRQNKFRAEDGDMITTESATRSLRFQGGYSHRSITLFYKEGIPDFLTVAGSDGDSRGFCWYLAYDRDSELDADRLNSLLA